LPAGDRKPTIYAVLRVLSKRKTGWTVSLLNPPWVPPLHASNLRPSRPHHDENLPFSFFLLVVVVPLSYFRLNVPLVVGVLFLNDLIGPSL